MGSNRGQNDISYAMYEELEGRLRVDPYADPLYIYKRSVVQIKNNLKRHTKCRIFMPVLPKPYYYIPSYNF